MAGDNKTLGRFDLVGIPPAPRGVPQIEVTFDIDANGIVHVSAKDLGTGKEQAITITSSSGLNKDEIDRMVKEAEQYASDDAKQKERIEAINQAESLVYTTEKSLKEYESKLPAELKSEIEDRISQLKKALESKETESIKKKTDELMTAAQKLGEIIYKEAAQKQQAEPTPQAGPAPASDKTSEPANDENVVDAEFKKAD